MGKVGDGMQSLLFINIQREIKNWENKAFDLTCKLIKENEEEEPHRAEVVIKKRIRDLKLKIEVAKKRCIGI